MIDPLELLMQMPPKQRILAIASALREACHVLRIEHSAVHARIKMILEAAEELP